MYEWKDWHLQYLFPYFMLHLLLLALFNMMTLLMPTMLSLLPTLFISICLQILPRDWQLFLHFFLYMVEAVVMVVVVVVVMVSLLYGMQIFLIKIHLFSQCLILPCQKIFHFPMYVL